MTEEPETTMRVSSGNFATVIRWILLLFYEHWGMSVSGSEREYASRYPLLDKQIWKINPLSDDPFEDVGQYETSSFRYRVNRSAWKVAAWDSEGRENEDKEYKSESDWKTADNLLDGNPYSYWSSYLSPQ